MRVISLPIVSSNASLIASTRAFMHTQKREHDDTAK